MAHPDLLSDVLRSVRLRGVLYFHVKGTRRWAAEAPSSREIAGAVMPGAEHVMEYHVVIAGSCWAAVVGDAAVRLETGDIVAFPHGDPHVLSSAAGMRAPPNAAGYFERQARRTPFVLHLGAHELADEAVADDPQGATIVCGFLGCDLRPFNPLIASLPRLMHVRHDAGQPWTVQLMRQAAAESRDRRPGGDAMLERLSEMTFIDAVRRYLAGMPKSSRGWLAGTRDRFVGRTLALMHEAPARAWTVDELGRLVGLSRSALHERFADMVGQAPMQYLANWRMQVGAALLRDTPATVASIAQDVGYQSEAAFTRAFKRLVGDPPSIWRLRSKARAQPARDA
ncbi:MAG: AraC family transcriptional regulator, partial [Burkholderiales bacterium]|nr:AraC family transcriptional regulator [Burkholderiales bacterium]